MGEYAQALGAYEQALRLRPSFWQAAHEQGRTRYRLGEVDEAIKQLQNAASLSDELAPSIIWRSQFPGRQSPIGAELECAGTDVHNSCVWHGEVAERMPSRVRDVTG